MAVAFVAPLVVYLVVFYAYPLVQNFAMSLHRYDRATFVNGGAPFVGLDIYREVIAQPKFWRVVGQTAVFTFASITASTSSASRWPSSSSRSFRLSATLRALFLVPWLLPVIVSGDHLAVDDEPGQRRPQHVPRAVRRRPGVVAQRRSTP